MSLFSLQTWLKRGQVKNVELGRADGNAGTLKIFPGAANKGYLNLSAAANTGDTALNIVNAAHGQTTTLTIPDCGASAGRFLLSTGTNGLGTARYIPLFSGRNSSYTVFDATGSSSLWKLAGTVGTQTNLQTAAAQNNTKTGVGLWEVTLPDNYVAGQNISLIANCHRTVASGTTLTTKIDAEVFLMTSAGGAGADICATAEITFTDTAGADQTFTITGTTLTPGARILIRMTGTATEGGNAGTVVTNLNSLRIA